MPKIAKTKAERLDSLLEQEKALKAKIAKVKAAQSAADRKADTHRKIVVGAAVLAHAEIDAAFAEGLRKVLAKSVTRPNDIKAIADWLKK